MERSARVDRLYLERAYELARRGAGGTSPNPPVGAVVVQSGEITGEGYHHRAGSAHAEAIAIEAAGDRARGATLYVSLEPCNHTGRTPPCSRAVAASGIARVVVGAADPNPITGGGGLAYLRDCGIEVELANEAAAAELIAPFARAVRSGRPFLTLKMAMSMDGFVASRRGVQQWLTGEMARSYVRELRIEHDAVAVGAGTVRVDDPLLTVRPAHRRQRPYVRVVITDDSRIDAKARVFAALEGYARSVVVAVGAHGDFSTLESAADVIRVTDVDEGLRELRARGINSVLCEGGPSLAESLLQKGLVDRLTCLVAPRLLRSADAVPVIGAGALSALRGLRVERVERLGGDLLVTGAFGDV